MGMLFGPKGINVLNQVIYAVFVWLIADQCRKAMPGPAVLRRNSAIGLVAVLPYIVLPFYFAIAGGRTIADPIYTYGIMAMILFLFRINRRDYKVTVGTFTTRFAMQLAATIVLVDLSRPYGIFSIIVFMIAVTWIAIKRRIGAKLGIRIVALFGATILVVAPYHIIQQANAGSIILSNWGGCNLVEVFPFPSALERVPNWDSADKQDQLKSAAMCKEAQAEVLAIVKNQPTQALGYLLRPKRLVQLFGPWGVFQYSGIINLLWTIPLFSGPILLQWARALLLSTQSCQALFTFTSLLCWIPMILSFFSHSGQEAAGVLMGFYLPLYFTSLIFCQQHLRLKQEDSLVYI